MARLARLSIAGQPHHVWLRGAAGTPVFHAPEDFRRFLMYLGQVGSDELAIHAYVLMPDHVQLLATPATAQALGRAMQWLGRQYVRWFNQCHGRRGTLWAGRFRSSVCEPAAYLLDVSRFIETQPQRAGLATEAESYPWSSIHHHLGHVVDPVIRDHPVVWGLGNTPFERQSTYRDMIARPVDAQREEQIRWSVLHGWALGSAEFLQDLMAPDGRPLLPRPRGRRRKDASATTLP